MDDVDRRSDDVEAQLVSAVIGGASTPALRAHLDRLLRWTASPEARETAPIGALFRNHGVDLRWARRLVLMLLEETLFAERALEPHRVLGLGPGATGAQARRRYHLLMRVYHPDLSDEAPGWLTERAERINDAYARLQEGRPTPVGARSRRAAASGGRRLRTRPRRRRDRVYTMQRIRRKLGRPRAVRRHALVGVLLACAALVVHSCVVNQSWKEWRSQARASAAPPPFLGGASGPGRG